MSIHILPPDVAAKIAAGEVVERPASVVKELVENALDAGAKTIRVEIRAGGKRLIQVMDDGAGIPAEELPLALARHATSKLLSADDLSRVMTLGFRGEALASIAAVSQLTLVSRPAAQVAATRIRVEGGEQVALGPAGAAAGTLLTVENLFYNVPARLKFLKAEATEAGQVHRIVSHYALAYPQIRFILQSDNRTTLQTSGSGALLDTLSVVFGLEAAKEMLPLADGEDAPGPGGVTVRGYVGAPALHRGSRDQIIFFINNRWIQDRALSQAVVQAYHTFLPVGRYPLAVLNIVLDPAEVDVNVHPTKAEVKFRDPAALFKAVQKAVRETIIAAAPMPAYGTHPAPTSAFSGGGHAASHYHHAGRQSDLTAGSQLALEIQRTAEQGTLPAPAEEADKMPMMRVIGQIQRMYIVTEGPTGLYLIDQHAAHERILYERLMTQKAAAGAARQQLLEPALVELSPGQAAVLEAELEALTGVGFELEPFGGTAYRIRAVPEMLTQAEPGQALVDILAEMAEGAVPLARETHDRVAVTVCKRASIKGGQVLSYDEMRELVRQLEATTAPRTCPHGRPTMLHLSGTELARQFGRMA